MGVFDVLLSVSPAQVGVHHPSGDGTGPNDADFDDDVVVVARFQPGEHRHLCAAFQLKDPYRVAGTKHPKQLLVAVGDLCHGALLPEMLSEEVEAIVQVRQGAQS